jgi:hypothetical protein
MSSILQHNLLALGTSSPATSRLLKNTTARSDIEFFPARSGVLTGSLGSPAAPRLLASRHDPIEESRDLVETIDPKATAAAVVMGFGLGYHVKLLAQRLGPTSAIFVYEPDVGLLRAVLERIDHSGWMRQSQVLILTSAEDAGAIAAATHGREGVIAIGAKMVNHPSSVPRLGADAQRFADEFTKVIRAVKSTVITALMQSEVTVRNLLMNIDHYAMRPGVADLAGAARGRPAIVVSAGPSLRRNIDLLSRPGVRERFVIIAVQTVLKTLLARGIRPHFVTALDHHEISRRFYEGLSSADVDGVTLIAEAKANPAILEAFAGAIRMPGDAVLDKLLGQEPVPGNQLKAGATVAHLAYYLARHLGCDPVILIGQDLGFTDGQYYAAGAAIHEVWSGELNAFNSLEAMEWQRIVRNRSNLQRTSDVLGRPIYTDAQMASYLVQFERDFKADAEQGLTTIDATEGGVAKQHTHVSSLDAALQRFRSVDPLRLAEPRQEPGRPRQALEMRLRQIRQDVWKIADRGRRTQALLEEMVKHQSDQRVVNGLIAKVDLMRDEVMALQPAFDLVEYMNQTGIFKRVRADRELGLEQNLPPIERQRRQIERDITNVRWIAEAADQLGDLLDATLRSVAGAPKVTGDPPARDQAEQISGDGAADRRPRRVVALIPVDTASCGLGTPRKLAEHFLGDNPLRLTLRRLSRCKQLDSAILLTNEPERVARIAGDIPGLDCVIVPTAQSPLATRGAAVGAGRLWARSCWRGGLGGMSIYDEVLAPREMAKVMAERGVDAAALIGADWCLVDPELVDAAIDRFRQNPTGRSAHRLTFVQAPPGLGTAVIERSLMEELARTSDQAGIYASIGAMLGYIPIAPIADPITKPICVSSDPTIRDSQFRFIPDSQPRRAALARALGALDLAGASALEVASLVRQQQLQPPPGPPQELLLELCTGRRTSGPRGAWLRSSADSVERPTLSLAAAERIFRDLARAREDAAVTFGGAGDPLQHPEVFKLAALAKRCGIAGVHIRTDLACDESLVDRLLESSADVISIDLMAETPKLYRRLMGADLFARVSGNLERLIQRRQDRPTAGGLPTPWIVPRVTRCEATYEEIEAFYDRWLLGAGAAAIDPLPGCISGDRIEPLPIPAVAGRRLARERMTILSDGRVPASDSDFSGERCIGDVNKEGLLPVWRRLITRRYELLVEPRLEPSLHGSAARAQASGVAAGVGA